jgi:flavodoxin
MRAKESQKVLVAYYSRTGITAKIAREIAQRCNADVEEIRDVRNRRGIVGYFRSAREALRRTAGAIQPPEKKWRDYDCVLLGTPVWAGHLSSPVRAYVAQRLEPVGRIGFFCTMGGRGSEQTFFELDELTGMTPAATLALTDRDIASHRIDEALSAFVDKVANRSITRSHIPTETLTPASAH